MAYPYVLFLTTGGMQTKGKVEGFPEYFLAVADTGAETVKGMGNDWEVYFVNNSGSDIARLRIGSSGYISSGDAHATVAGGPREDRGLAAGEALSIDCADWDCFYDYSLGYTIEVDGKVDRPTVKMVMLGNKYPLVSVPHLGGRPAKVVEVAPVVRQYHGGISPLDSKNLGKTVISPLVGNNEDDAKKKEAAAAAAKRAGEVAQGYGAYRRRMQAMERGILPESQGQN